MKSLKRSLLAILLLGLMSTGVQAALLIEPHLGYNVSGSGDSTTGGTKMEVDYSGVQYGLRAGWQYLGFMIGADYTASNPEVETTVAGQKFKNDFNNREIGIFAGYNLPILLRAWVGYYFDASAETDSASLLFEKGTEFNGSTTELGIGFTGLPLVSLNLMYRNTSYDEIKDSSGTTKLNGSEKIDSSEIVFGVSVPFTL